MYINKSRASGSAYWALTSLTIQGRPKVLVQLICYILYASGLAIILLNLGGNDNRYAASYKSLSSGLNLIGVALFFLQTFRTNSSYQIWSQARINLGQFLTCIRSIMNHVAAGHIQSQRLSSRMLRWMAALMQVTKLTLRGKHKDIESVQEIISINEFEKLAFVEPGTRWLFIVQQIEEVWAEGRYS